MGHVDGGGEQHGLAGAGPGVLEEVGRRAQQERGAVVAAELVDAIADPAVAAIARRTRMGGIDLISDNTDLRENTELRPKLAALYL